MHQVEETPEVLSAAPRSEQGPLQLGQAAQGPFESGLEHAQVMPRKEVTHLGCVMGKCLLWVALSLLYPELKFQIRNRNFLDVFE